MSKIISSLPKIKPSITINAKTGEIVSTHDYESSMKRLVAYVQEETKNLYIENKEKLTQDILSAKRIGSPNSFARSRGYASTYKTLDKEILAKSRINELILHKLVSEVSSHVLNPNMNKQEPGFSPKINLGAVNKQMASLSLEGDNLSLLWKCWDREFLLEFTIPKYYQTRNITKWSLPVIQVEKGEVWFYFAFQENPQVKPNKGIRAGLDLGRVEPYTMVIVDEDNVTHSYTGNKIVKRLEEKRTNILKERKHILTKLSVYQNLGINNAKKEKLESEAKRKAHKANKLGVELAHQMGNDIATKLSYHHAHELMVEDLSWVRGKKYGGRWNHSTQQASITHSLARRGMKVRKTPAANTSQYCHKCKTKIIHNTKHRTVYCGDCKTILDRDFNAALNILKKQYYPNPLVSAIHGNNGLSPKQDITISQQEQETILNQNPTKTGTVQGIPCHAGWSL